MKPCLGRYCECRYHLDPSIPAWAIEAYMPSPWVQEVLHAMWVEGRTEATEDERAVMWAELTNLAEAARDASRRARR